MAAGSHRVAAAAAHTTAESAPRSHTPLLAPPAGASRGRAATSGASSENWMSRRAVCSTRGPMPPRRAPRRAPERSLTLRRGACRWRDRRRWRHRRHWRHRRRRSAERPATTNGRQAAAREEPARRGGHPAAPPRVPRAPRPRCRHPRAAQSGETPSKREASWRRPQRGPPSPQGREPASVLRREARPTGILRRHSMRWARRTAPRARGPRRRQRVGARAERRAQSAGPSGTAP